MQFKNKKIQAGISVPLDHLRKYATAVLYIMYL